MPGMETPSPQPDSEAVRRAQGEMLFRQLDMTNAGNLTIGDYFSNPHNPAVTGELPVILGTDGVSQRAFSLSRPGRTPTFEVITATGDGDPRRFRFTMGHVRGVHTPGRYDAKGQFQELPPEEDGLVREIIPRAEQIIRSQNRV